LSLLFSLKNPDKTAQTMPEQNAPMINGILSKYDIIIPGSTEWLIASPINDHPLSTKKHESRAAGTDMIAAIMKAFIIKLYWNGVTNMSAIISVCF
jgi:hypothetical protein